MRKVVFDIDEYIRIRNSHKEWTKARREWEAENPVMTEIKNYAAAVFIESIIVGIIFGIGHLMGVWL